MDQFTDLELTLKELVAYKTTENSNGQLAKLFSYVKNQLDVAGLNIKEFNDDGFPILYFSTKGNLTPKTLLVAHADVLPAPAELFEMKSDQDKLYGRGVWDMKFAIAGYIELIRTLSTKLAGLDFGILITSDEETRNKNVEFALKQGIKPQRVVLLDGSNGWQVEKASKGAWTIKVTASGKSVHGSKPWEGDSASLKLLDALTVIRSWFDESQTEGDSLNISVLSAGDAINQVPDSAEAILDIRIIDEKNKTTYQEKLKDLNDKYDLSIQELVDLPPLHQDMQDPALRSFIKIASEIAGAKTEGVISAGASEASYFAQAGIPVIVTRPVGGGHHSDDEWVDRKSLSLIVPILTSFIEN